MTTTKLALLCVLVALLLLASTSRAFQKKRSVSSLLRCDFESPVSYCFWENRTVLSNSVGWQPLIPPATDVASAEDISNFDASSLRPTTTQPEISFYPLAVEKPGHQHERPVLLTPQEAADQKNSNLDINVWKGLFNRRNNVTNENGGQENQATLNAERIIKSRSWEKIDFFTLTYGQSSESELVWKVRRGDDFNQSDHSLKSREGKFLALDLRDGGLSRGSSLTSAFLYTSPYQDTCVTFWYVLNDYSRSVSLSAYRSDSNITKTSSKIWSVRGHRGPYWFGANLFVPATGFPSYVLFEAVFTSTDGIDNGARGGYIGLDDISITSGQCPGQGSCDFEIANQCLWENRIGREQNFLKFERIRGNERRKENWPGSDKSTGTEFGNYLIASNATEQSHVASFTSEGFPIRGCLKNGTLNFWYFLPELDDYEDDEPLSLIVYLYDGMFVDADFELSRFVLRKDLKRKEWALLSVPFEIEYLASKADMFYFLIAVELGYTEPLLFLAIDDISVDLNYECRDAFECEYQSRERLPKEKVCNFEPECSSSEDEKNCGICGFEGSFCGYSQSRSARDANEECGWFRTLAAGNRTFGPKSDLEGREYIMTKADLNDNDRDGRNESTSILLYSPWLQNSSPSCFLSFAYSTSRFASLFAYLEISKPKAIMNVFDSKLSRTEEGQDSSSWSRDLVLLGPIYNQFRIRFQGHYAEEVTGADRQELQRQFVALDAIKFENCSPERVACFSADAFSCSNGFCIPQDRICDHVDDCGDGSDEQKCVIYPLNCDFEEEACEWMNYNNLAERTCSIGFCSTKDWKQSSGKSSVEFGPSRDHTTGLPGGNFLILTASAPKIRKRVILRSPVIGSFVSNYAVKQGVTRSLCKIRFFYLFEGSNYMRLLVKLKHMDQSSKRVIWEANNAIRTHGYQRALITINVNEYARILIQGIVELNENRTSYVAIDDISFTRGCQLEILQKPPQTPPLVV